jgi:hypothetical protein
MKPTLVIVLPQVVNDFSGVENITGPVLIQLLIPKSTMTDFDKPILCRLTQLNQLEQPVMFFGSLCQ